MGEPMARNWNTGSSPWPRDPYLQVPCHPPAGAHLDPSVCGFYQLIHEQLAREVIVEKVILGINTFWAVWAVWAKTAWACPKKVSAVSVYATISLRLVLAGRVVQLLALRIPTIKRSHRKNLGENMDLFSLGLLSVSFVKIDDHQQFCFHRPQAFAHMRDNGVKVNIVAGT